MPPAKQRTRSYDAVKTRTAVLAQAAALRSAVGTLTPEQLDGPTRLDGWRVRELVAHLSMVLGTLTHALTLPAPPKAGLTLLEWPARVRSVAGAIDDDVRAGAEAAGDGVADAFGLAVDAIGPALADPFDGDRPVMTRLAPMRLTDVLVTRCLELIVHTDDLNDATGLDVPYDRQALATAVRLLADALAADAPGGAVEVRIPPFAVVQCVEGPRHTRGTPPNVVETDPLTWVRLATGRAGWAAELDAARISASGERADLSGLLPVLG
ncbi:maleylpyruvate isomerase family mycothiol-dependent enzyme [Streptomyces yaizuensis]|uniref:Maleylpyruvate isomerase family mycothiol-dependent enzyme n=1 Tax=Streptomyces yaizuensis TaxID=2989713 RepID=A0ABQ5P1T0_9ACTN|nr:sterol carrier family protein [Streptomyces sp. YSPA8]GLF96540.1 maleylpyruvate isomerase family mycothiol-dependent enzyme [Streptomyces sp. YSPA8]